MSQVRTKQSKAASLLGNAAFKAGVADFQFGFPHAAEYDLCPDTNTAWAYERGRLFAACGGTLATAKRGNSKGIGILKNGIWTKAII